VDDVPAFGRMLLATGKDPDGPAGGSYGWTGGAGTAAYATAFWRAVA